MDVAALQLNEIPFQFFEFFFSFCFSRWVPLFLGVFPAYSDSSLLKCYFHGCWSTKPCSLYFIWSMQLHFTFNRMCVEFVCVNSNNFFSSVSKCVKHSQDVLVFDGDEEKTKKNKHRFALCIKCFIPSPCTLFHWSVCFGGWVSFAVGANPSFKHLDFSRSNSSWQR